MIKAWKKRQFLENKKVPWWYERLCHFRPKEPTGFFLSYKYPIPDFLRPSEHLVILCKVGLKINVLWIFFKWSNSYCVLKVLLKQNTFVLKKHFFPFHFSNTRLVFWYRDLDRPWFRSSDSCLWSLVYHVFYLYDIYFTYLTPPRMCRGRSYVSHYAIISGRQS